MSNVEGMVENDEARRKAGKSHALRSDPTTAKGRIVVTTGVQSFVIYVSSFVIPTSALVVLAASPQQLLPCVSVLTWSRVI
jgi:hypothetical protein